MSDLAQRIYNRLPGPARNIAASARGTWLRWWRYHGDFEPQVDAALERDGWSAERWTTWREERTARVLHRAATRVPYYRQLWAQRRRSGDERSWDRLENWPILDKESIRQDARAFVADDRDPKRMFCVHTSGTTGKPLDVFQSRDSVRTWYALFEARCRRWHGVSRRDRWATIGGQLVTPVSQRKPPFWVWNSAMNQLYMSSYHLAPDLIPHYFDALVRYRVRCLEVYPSSLYALAEEALRIGRDDLDMSIAITNAEPVFDYQREAISRAFGCPVRETYGMAETVSSASECEAGRLHVWPEVGTIEVVDASGHATDTESGDIVCTGLLNADMPLIRYRIGDRGRLSVDATDCECGRALPALASIDGRMDDVLYTADGRRIGRLDPVFKTGIPIREAQIVQESLTTVRVVYVPAPGYTDATGQTIAARLRDRMGDIDVVLEERDALPRTTNGKFRAVISHVRPNEIPRRAS